ncbi:MAG: RNA-binding domain-containing protein [Promethearchaeati archaeon SRVP18_Atabeyarchaeia-1]
MIKVHVEVPVYPTENPDKVKMALSNIVFGVSFSERVEGQVKYLLGISDGSVSLSQIQRHLKDQAISTFARKTLSKSMIEGNRIRFYLNKQAAFMGVVHFCETKNESPLGPITVEIESDDIKSVIDYLTGQIE